MYMYVSRGWRVTYNIRGLTHILCSYRVHDTCVTLPIGMTYVHNTALIHHLLHVSVTRASYNFLRSTRVSCTVIGTRYMCDMYVTLSRERHVHATAFWA